VLEKIDEKVENFSNSSKKSYKDEENSSFNNGNSSKNDSFTNHQRKIESSSLSPVRKTLKINTKKSSEDVITSNKSAQRRNTQSIAKSFRDAPKITNKNSSILQIPTNSEKKIRKSSFNILTNKNPKIKNQITTLSDIDEINTAMMTKDAKDLKKKDSKSLEDFNITSAKLPEKSLDSFDNSKINLLDGKMDLDEEKIWHSDKRSLAEEKKYERKQSYSEDKQSSQEKQNFQEDSQKTIGKFEETPREYIRKDLGLIVKCHTLRQAKKLHSMYVKLEHPKQNISITEPNEIENENLLLLQIIKKKNPVLLFSQHIFPKNKPFQKKIEFILEHFLNNKRRSEYFDFVYGLLKNKEIPIQNQHKSIQTTILSLANASSQADLIKPSLMESDLNRKEKDNSALIKIIDKLQQKGQDWDFTNTTSSSIESKPDKTPIFSKTQAPAPVKPENSTNEIRKFTSPGKLVNIKRNNQLNIHLNSSNYSRSTYHERNSIEKIMNSNVEPSTVRVNSLHYFTKNFTERADKGKKIEESNFNMNATGSVLKEAKTEEDDNFEPKIEDVITKEVFDHIQKMNKKDDKNYSKIKFLFKYPFRSINAKFDKNKKQFQEEVEKDEVEIDEKDNLSYDKFQMFFKRMVKTHKKCGVNCLHLRRFFKSIGFEMKVPGLKHEMLIHKNIINKLPKIN